LQEFSARISHEVIGDATRDSIGLEIRRAF